MPNLSYPFEFYDPLTDQRLNPPTADELYHDVRIPDGLHHTVQQALALLPGFTLDGIRVIAGTIGPLCEQANFLRIEHWQELTQRNYIYSDEAEDLRFVFTHGKHDISPAYWASHMGVLALALAGEIHNELWPTPEYLGAKRSVITGNNMPILEDKRLREFATVAARAAAYGEAFRDILAADAKFRETNRKNGPKAHQPKNQIADKFIAWAIQLPRPNQFANTLDAVKWFLEQHLSAQEKPYATAHGFSRTLSNKLKTYVALHQIPHPFRQS